MIVVLGIFILYTNISIGKGPNRTNYENRENSMNKEKESSFASIQAVVNKEYGLPENYKPNDLVVPNVPNFSIK